ncbi:MAG: ribonuclease HIII [Bacilli bacterium]|nr:ribonuclease HIII [Bacilli bacterium]
MNKPSVISFKVSENTAKMMEEELSWCMRPTTPQYARFQAKDGDTVITLYESGKVVFQGKDADIASDFWIATEKLNNKNLEVKDSSTNTKKSDIYVDPKIYNSSSIGSDEVGTGDFFGPMVVTASYVDKSNISKLEKLGVKDSKKMTDEKILEVIPELIKFIPYSSVVLSNKEYNERYQSGNNMNALKAILHNKVLMDMKNKTEKYDYIVVDEFAKPKTYFGYLAKSNNVCKDITFMTKGEDKCLSVACSSLISRYLFIKEMDKLSSELGMVLPKGASDAVDKVGIQIVNKYGFDKLNEIAKMNFKNVDKIKDSI